MSSSSAEMMEFHLRALSMMCSITRATSAYLVLPVRVKVSYFQTSSTRKAFSQTKMALAKAAPSTLHSQVEKATY